MYELVDYWSNGSIDVMIDKNLIAEIEPEAGGYVLSFSVKVRFSDLEAVNKWVNCHISEMEALVKAAG